MSIQSEITRINNAVVNMKTALSEKGISVNNNDGIETIAGYVNKISSGGSSSFPNGTEWTRSNIISSEFNCVYNGNGIWIAGGYNKGLYYSTDGKYWTKSNITSDAFSFVYNANGIWVAGGNGSGLYYSTDGKSWTQSKTGSFTCVYYANGIWVAGGVSNYLYYSTNCINWYQSNIRLVTIKSIYNANGIWVAGSNSGNTGLYYSVTWEES